MGKANGIAAAHTGEYRHGMATEWHRSFTGTGSLGHIMEQRVIKILKATLPPTITVHMDPYDKEDEAYYYKHEVPKPNPEFPPKSNQSYIFQTLGRESKTESRNTYRDHYTQSRWLSPLRRGPREYYLDGHESLEEKYGHAPERNIKVPHTPPAENQTDGINNDSAWDGTNEWEPPESDGKNGWTNWDT